MCYGFVLADCMNKLLREWNFIWSDGRGIYKGLVTGWKGDLVLIKSFSMNSVLGTSFISKEMDLTFSIFNTCEPYF